MLNYGLYNIISFMLISCYTYRYLKYDNVTPLSCENILLELNDVHRKSVGVRVRLMVRGGCLPVNKWQYADHLCECGTKETGTHVFVDRNYYNQMRRRWMRAMDGLDEKGRTMDVIMGYV